MAEPSNPGFFRFAVGPWRLLALHEGTLIIDLPAGFVRQAGNEEVSLAYQEAGMAKGKLSLTFTSLAIETADGLVLIDPGFGQNGPASAGRLATNLAGAGRSPDEVTTVLISHFHRDHISGLISKDGLPTYPNARVLVPGPEWTFWTDKEKAASAPAPIADTFALCSRVFSALGERVSRFAWDETVLPGVVARGAPGHTLGHTAFEIGSGEDMLIYVGDITNNPLVFARYPDWSAAFDMDPEQAIATRKRILDAAAAAKTRLFFFHAPFPSLATVSRSGSGYTYFPAMWS